MRPPPRRTMHWQGRRQGAPNPASACPRGGRPATSKREGGRGGREEGGELKGREGIRGKADLVSEISRESQGIKSRPARRKLLEARGGRASLTPLSSGGLWDAVTTRPVALPVCIGGEGDRNQTGALTILRGRRGGAAAPVSPGGDLPSNLRPQSLRAPAGRGPRRLAQSGRRWRPTSRPACGNPRFRTKR